jgi:thiol:disulfide interchange protein
MGKFILLGAKNLMSLKPLSNQKLNLTNIYPMKFLKATLSFVAMLLLSLQVSAQILNPIKWESEALRTEENTFQLIFTATIDDGWHLYSQDLPDVFPRPEPTEFYFDTLRDVSLEGKTLEGESEHEYDPNFEMDLNYFSHKAVFSQIVKITSDRGVVKGAVGFMTCDDSRCLPPDYFDFEFTLDNNMPIKKAIAITGGASVHKDEVKAVETKEGDEEEEEQSMGGIFIAGFLGGFLALLTPCVFPMIPLTVSFFTKQSKNKASGIANALLYGISIIVIYVGLGLLITKTLGPDALNALASNGIMNFTFFVIFVVFAISFLGAFEITLPSKWVNKADTASSKGGLIGIFFMAFTLSLVSFSCTGPIIGSLLVEAAVQGGYQGPMMGMFGFSLALALPFTLFAIFPGWLNSLPKSGGWLNSVKVVLGLLELAFAMKFLSNVDLAYHWELLTRELFLAIWIVIFSILGFYLLGKIRFSHDSKMEYTPIPRLFMAIITFSFVVYLIPGMWGAPLKLISAFPPPDFYSEGWNAGASGSGLGSQGEYIEGVERSHCPHNLPCFHDYDIALAYAKTQGKPLMVDFTGWSCVNCRRMEANVWVDQRVLKRLEEDFVLVSLYVDDKEDLPKDKQYVSEVTGKKIRTVGNRWSDMQTSRFKTNSQPYYVVMDHEGNTLGKPHAYDLDIDKFIHFLDSGMKEFKAGTH